MKNSRKERERESVWVPENLFHRGVPLFNYFFLGGSLVDATRRGRKERRVVVGKSMKMVADRPITGIFERVICGARCVYSSRTRVHTHKYFPWVSPLDIKIFYVAARIHDADAPAYKHYAYRSAHVHT